MTERRGDQGFSVAPRRIGDDPRDPRRRRTRRLGLAVVIGAAAAIIAIAWLGPRLSDRPYFDVSFFATPTPRPPASGSVPSAPRGSPSPTPFRTPQATPLPDVTLAEGAHPVGQVAIGVDGLRVLDLATGRLEYGADSAVGRDAVVRDPGGDGWICLCLIDDLDGSQPVRDLRLTDIDVSGRTTRSTSLATLAATYDDSSGQPSPLTDIDLVADRTHGLLALARRIGSDDGWQVSVAAIDVTGRSLGASVDIGVAPLPAIPGPSPAPSPTPTPEPGTSEQQAYLDGPHVRLSPDGRVAVVWGVVQRSVGDSVVTSMRGWRVALGEDGSIGTVAPMDGLDAIPNFCGILGFAAADRIAWICPVFPSNPTPETPLTWQLGALDPLGSVVTTREVETSQDSYFGEPLFDRANGQMYAWDPTKLTLLRFDVHTFEVTTVVYDAAATASPGLPPAGGSQPVQWQDADSAVQLFGYSQLAGSADGTRLYGIGFEMITTSDAMSQGSRGIFAIDRSTLALVGRWAPAADYIAVSAMANGQVLGIGMPGVDASGREAPWQASLTVHDPADGRILVRYGQLGQGQFPAVYDR